LETLIALCGSEVDVIDNNGCTAIFYAITLGHADCTELLLNFGAEPNRQDRKGRTPAHCMKQFNFADFVVWVKIYFVQAELPKVNSRL